MAGALAAAMLGALLARAVRLDMSEFEVSRGPRILVSGASYTGWMIERPGTIERVGA